MQMTSFRCTLLEDRPHVFGFVLSNKFFIDAELAVRISGLHLDKNACHTLEVYHAQGKWCCCVHLMKKVLTLSRPGLCLTNR
jgi:hypothetical protein